MRRHRCNLNHSVPPRWQSTLPVAHLGQSAICTKDCFFTMVKQTVTRQSQLTATSTTAGINPTPNPNCNEQHFKPAQLAGLWQLSTGSIRQLFRDEPGVICLDRPEQLNKRPYCTMRIPLSVARRVHGKLRSH